MIDPEVYLHRYGYLAAAGSAGLAGAVAAFRRAFGLPAGEQIDPAVTAAMRLPRCGCSDALATSGDGRWHKRYLGVFVESYVGAIAPGDQDDLVGVCCRDWEAVCDVHFHRVLSRPGADIVISTARGPHLGFDGNLGILAQAQMPPGDDRALMLWLDLDERWVVSAADAGILYRNVLAHELGHILGLTHSRQPRAIMAPTYAPGIATPQKDDDIPRAQGLFGPPQGPPTPPEPVAGRRIVLEFDGPVPLWRARAA